MPLVVFILLQIGFFFKRYIYIRCITPMAKCRILKQQSKCRSNNLKWSTNIENNLAYFSELWQKLEYIKLAFYFNVFSQNLNIFINFVYLLFFRGREGCTDGILLGKFQQLLLSFFHATSKGLCFFFLNKSHVSNQWLIHCCLSYVQW